MIIGIFMVGKGRITSSHDWYDATTSNVQQLLVRKKVWVVDAYGFEAHRLLRLERMDNSLPRNLALCGPCR